MYSGSGLLGRCDRRAKGMVFSDRDCSMQLLKNMSMNRKGKTKFLRSLATGEVESLETKDGQDVIKTVSGTAPHQEVYHYATAGVVGNGSFGVVFQATCLETSETVAIKKVLQDKRFKNRELQIIRIMDHPNVVSLKHCFFSVTDTDDRFLHLVLEFIPSTVYNAKMLTPGEANIAYICSRYYRAPELIFGATEYSNAIDIWSVGCVLAELIIGKPIFAGDSGVDQLVEIIKVLGTPSKDDILGMNPNYNEFRFPQIKSNPWHKVFAMEPALSAEAIDLISGLLKYSPTKRLSGLEAMAHPFFAEILQPDCSLPGGKPLPPLTGWIPGELRTASAEILSRLGVVASDEAVTGLLPKPARI